jgi:type IV secretory pathway VirB2 component (pilin)
MNELAETSSRLGQISTTVAIVSFIVMLILAIAGYLALSLFESDLKYKVGILATMFFFVFPLVAIIGLIIGGIGYFQPNYAKFYSVLGVVLNVLNLLLWVGFVIFQITFNANRFRL